MKNEVCQCTDDITLTDEERLLNKCSICGKKLVVIEEVEEPYDYFAELPGVQKLN